MMDMEKTEFIRCPICGNKTRDKVREDTILKNFPLFCPKCKSECLIDVEQFHINLHFGIFAGAFGIISSTL